MQNTAFEREIEMRSQNYHFSVAIWHFRFVPVIYFTTDYLCVLFLIWFFVILSQPDRYIEQDITSKLNHPKSRSNKFTKSYKQTFCF